MATNDYYELLGVSRDANDSEIKSAYKKLAKKYHPDVSKEPDSQEKFKDISKAYQVLSDTDKRAAYDQMGHAGFEQASKTGFSGAGGSQGYGQYNINIEDLFGGGGFGYQDPFDVFNDLFGGRSRRSGGTESLRGEDIEVAMNLTFEEAVHGAEQEINYNVLGACEQCDSTGSASKDKSSHTCSQCDGTGKIRIQQSLLGANFTQVATCPTCNGSGVTIKDPCTKCNGEGRTKTQETVQIKVPAGVDSGTRIKYNGKGNHGKQGHPAGDLYIQFRVKPHDKFIRRGYDIYLEVPISPPQAALGANIKIPTIDGEKTLKIPAGSQNGKKLKLSGAGIPQINSSRKGDQIVIVQVKTPEKLSKQEKDLYKQLLEVENKPQSIFNKLFS